MNSVFFRTALLLLHAVFNFLLINWLLDYDIGSKWIYFGGFILLLLLLLYLFIRHLVSYIYFLKNKLP